MTMMKIFYVFLLCVFASPYTIPNACANNSAVGVAFPQHSTSALPLQLDAQLINSTNTKPALPKKITRFSSSTSVPKLVLSKTIDASILESMNNVFNNMASEETELKIAVGVQPTVSKEDYEITGNEITSDNVADEEALTPSDGQFTPNTEEENNIILASMLIIFTGAAIIAILSYI